MVGRRYRLERELTRGGMGVVWVATHLVTKRRVAIKLLRAGGHDDTASRARLLREARASCAVDHPSVLPVLDVIDAEGAPALVMELLEGESLRGRLERKGALAASEACAILAPVAAALAAAHAARIVHRDIKPENIFLVASPGREPTVKVLDFGIAKIVATEEATTNLTETGAMLGTPYYMAPEQAFGERDVGPAADAWALGIVLYECLSGARPTQAENLGQVIKRITQDPMMPVEQAVPNVPAELASLVGRLLQRDAAAREVDMANAAKVLAACAEPIAAVPASAAESEVATSPSGDPVRETGEGSPARGRRMAAVATAAVVAAVAIAFARSSTTSAPAGASSALPTASVAAPPSSPPPAPSASTSPAVPASAIPSEVLPTPRASSVVALPLPHASGAAPRAHATAGPDASASNASSATAANPRRVPAPDDGGATGPGHVIITTPF